MGRPRPRHRYRDAGTGQLTTAADAVARPGQTIAEEDGPSEVLRLLREIRAEQLRQGKTLDAIAAARP